jgi:O-antigen ligase
MALFLADLVRGEWAQGALLACSVGAAVEGILAIAQSVHHGPIGLWWLGEISGYNSPGFYRAPGLTVNPNNLGGYLLIGLFACILLIRTGSRAGQAMNIGLLCGLMIGGGLVATMSRSAMLAAIIALTPALGFAPRMHLRTSPIIGAALLAIALVVAVWAGITVVSNGQTHLLSMDRQFFFPDTNLVIQQSPILGVGADNLMLAIIRNRADSNAILLPAHNVYLVIWAELGVIGLVLFLAACLSVLIRSRLRNGIGVFTWGCCFLALCIVMGFDYYFWGDYRSRVLMFWVLGMWWGAACPGLTATPGSSRTMRA